MLMKMCLIKTCTKGKERLIEPPFIPRCCSPHIIPSSCAHVHLCSLHLARSTASGDVRAGGGLLTTSDGVTTPSPVGASALGAEDVDVGGGAGDGSSVLGDGQTSAVDFVSQTTHRHNVGKDNACIGTPEVGTPVGLPFS
jgi:hypothetical protein